MLLGACACGASRTSVDDGGAAGAGGSSLAGRSGAGGAIGGGGDGGGSPGYVCSPEDAEADAHGCIVALCSEGYSCPEGQTCEAFNADIHGCTNLQRDADGYVCPAGTHCSAMGTWDEHGCVDDCSIAGCTPGEQECGPDEECHDKTCGSDVSCGCGICVSGKCKGSLGVCDYGTGGTGA